MWRVSGQTESNMNMIHGTAQSVCIVLIGTDVVCQLEPRWLLAARARGREKDVETMRRPRGSRGGKEQAGRLSRQDGTEVRHVVSCCLWLLASVRSGMRNLEGDVQE
jgi:hypothetical protein